MHRLMKSIFAMGAEEGVGFSAKWRWQPLSMISWESAPLRCQVFNAGHLRFPFESGKGNKGCRKTMSARWPKLRTAISGWETTTASFVSTDFGLFPTAHGMGFPRAPSGYCLQTRRATYGSARQAED